MEDADFSDEFCRFLQRAVPAVDAAELLLLIADQPGNGWEIEEARARLGGAMTSAEAARYVEGFVAAGVVERAADGLLRCRPLSDPLSKHVRTLAQAYEERPVTLIRMIYALRDARITSFADAFRLRKK